MITKLTNNNDPATAVSNTRAASAHAARTPAASTSASSSSSTPSTGSSSFGETMANQLGPSLDTLFGAKPATASPTLGPTSTATTTLPTSGAGANTAAPAPPTVESVFGTDQIFMQNPVGTGPNGLVFQYNPIYFATQATAQKVASMVGGIAVEQNSIAPDGPLRQAQPCEMVQLPDGKTINAGLLANIFTHGYSQSYINTCLANAVKEAENS